MKYEREKRYTEKDRRKKKEIAKIFDENLKTLHKILTVLRFYLGDLNFFIIFNHLN